MHTFLVTHLAGIPAKLAATAVVLAVAWLIARVARIFGEHREAGAIRLRFWLHQSVRMLVTALWIAAVLAIWVEDTSRLGTIAALITAGLTVALQRVITSVAGYFSILRGSVFTVGDRITMGGVRGDVVALSYLRTTIMEMGQPPSVQDDEPGMWVSGRQYTGRIVTITNDKVFDTPVYNYTREFPFVWEEIRIPIRFHDDWPSVERMLTDTARRHTAEIVAAGREALPHLVQRFTLFEQPDLEPSTFVRITDNWIEVTVRFLARDRGVRALKSHISRDILNALHEMQIEVASTTIDIVGLPR